MSESFLDGKVTLHRGDCLEVLATLEADSIDSCVTDPPYHLTSIVKRFGKENSAPINNRDEREGRQGPYHRASKGFMGKQWDGGAVAFDPETWALVLRVLKPGGHLIAFGGTRTYHRMACAIEDAGFEIRDQIGWCYGSGFPKSHDVSKGIDRLAGAEREVVGNHGRSRPHKNNGNDGWIRPSHEIHGDITTPATEAAIQWQGWGTTLKPAWEPICLARKPLSESSIAANVLKHGTGGINVDGCRIGWQNPNRLTGRWPANLIHDGSEEVLAGFPETTSGTLSPHHKWSVPKMGKGGIYGDGDQSSPSREYAGDSGSAARFFYTAKADADDRLGSKHPTVKPLDLIQYLVRLITPRGGIVLDPFAGTGTCGEVAFREGMAAVLIEREAEYQADIVKRMGLCLAGPEERRAASVKQLPPDDLPIFEGAA